MENYSEFRLLERYDMIRLTLIVLILAVGIAQPCPARALGRTSGIGPTAKRAATDLRLSKAGRETPNHEVSARISPIASARSMLQR